MVPPEVMVTLAVAVAVLAVAVGETQTGNDEAGNGGNGGSGGFGGGGGGGGGGGRDYDTFGAMKMGLAAVAVKEEYLAEMVLRVLAVVVAEMAAKGAAVLV
jgi:hypothetical protein